MGEVQKILYFIYPFLTEKKQEVEEAVNGLVNQIKQQDKHLCVRSFGSLEGEDDAIKSIAYFKAGCEIYSITYAWKAICTYVAMDTFKNGVPCGQSECFDEYVRSDHNLEKSKLFVSKIKNDNKTI